MCNHYGLFGILYAGRPFYIAIFSLLIFLCLLFLLYLNAVLRDRWGTLYQISSIVVWWGGIERVFSDFQILSWVQQGTKRCPKMVRPQRSIRREAIQFCDLFLISYLFLLYLNDDPRLLGFTKLLVKSYDGCNGRSFFEFLSRRCEGLKSAQK